MDYLDPAFGKFSPHLDVDAAVKFILNTLLRDRGFDSLSKILTEGHPVGAVEGDPGWILERRDQGSLMPGYAEWPAGADFHAFVDPEFYEMKYPEYFMERKVFQHYVKAALDEYLRSNPSDADIVASIHSKFSE